MDPERLSPNWFCWCNCHVFDNCRSLALRSRKNVGHFQLDFRQVRLSKTWLTLSPTRWLGRISTPKPPPSADEIANMVVGKLPKQPGANEIAREVVAQMPQITNGPGPNAQIQQLTSALNAANKAREDLTQQLKTETAAQPKSPILGLDDSKRWQIFKIMQDAAADNQGQHIECQSVNSLPYDQNKLAIDLFSEFAEILSRAWPGGNLQGFKTPPHQPFGITFVLGGHSGTAFECASHLAGALQNIFQIPIVLRTDQASDNLAKCNNQCVEIRYGGER